MSPYFQSATLHTQLGWLLSRLKMLTTRPIPGFRLLAEVSRMEISLTMAK